MTAFKSSSRFKTIAAAGLLSAALVGCGGGSESTVSDSGGATDEPDKPPMDEPTGGLTPAQQAAINTVKAKYDSAKGFVGILTNQSSDESIQNARDTIQQLVELIGDTPDLPSDKAEEYTMLAEGLTTQLNSLRGEAVNARRWDDAIDVKALSGTNVTVLPERAGGPGGSTLRSDYTGGRAVINFTYDGTPLSGTAVSGLPVGWTGREYERRYTQGRVDSGRIFTSRGPDETKSMRWDQLATEQARIPNSLLGDVTVNDPNDATTFTVVVDATPPLVGTATTSTTQTRIHQSDLEQVTGYATAGGGVANPLAFSVPSRGNATELAAVGTNVYSANLFGKLGYLSCNNACTLTVDDNNFINVTSATAATSLTFTPAIPNATTPTQLDASNLNLPSFTVSMTRPDSSYMEFGYWAYVNPNPPAGTDPVQIETFARGNYGTNNGLTVDIPAISGTATYDGLAAGYYTFIKDSEYYNGEFTADATLTANFDSNTISGDIEEFMSVTDDAHDLKEWDLTLNDANIGTSRASFTNFNGNTTGGGDTGAWQGTFYGNTGIATGIANDDYPEAVLGEFTGHFANDGHVAGAFGADKTN